MNQLTKRLSKEASVSGCDNPQGASDGMNHSRRQILGLCAAMLTAPLRSLCAEPALGVILPRDGAVPAEALTMYPTGVRFLTEGFSTAEDGPLIGTLATYEKFKDRMVPAAEALQKHGAQAILLLGTSVT